MILLYPCGQLLKYLNSELEILCDDDIELTCL
jgi:hypothetical protein